MPIRSVGRADVHCTEALNLLQQPKVQGHKLIGKFIIYTLFKSKCCLSLLPGLFLFGLTVLFFIILSCRLSLSVKALFKLCLTMLYKKKKVRS